MVFGETTTERIKNYLRKNLSKGYTLDALRISLIHSQGYSPSIVDRAIKEFHAELAKEAPVLNEKPKIRYEVLDENNSKIIESTKNPSLFERIKNFFK
jgi:hypothetical protein